MKNGDVQKSLRSRAFTLAQITGVKDFGMNAPQEIK